jgi:hypothetical protein
MADKDVGRLAPLFHDRSKFVHMSSTWKKDEELEIIRTGSIWYKQTDRDAAGATNPDGMNRAAASLVGIVLA